MSKFLTKKNKTIEFAEVDYVTTSTIIVNRRTEDVGIVVCGKRDVSLHGEDVMGFQKAFSTWRQNQ